MILDVITLHNFRQYYGTQRIFFSQDRSRNITVIHGENGTGKTALLAAFKWCLYGELDLPQPEHIISERAAAEANPGEEIEAHVRLQFNDNARKYFVTRRIRARKSENGQLDYYQPELELEYIDETGRTKRPKNPQDSIEQIIPPDLRHYFFFDGERIDNLTKKESVKDIRRAIKILMGLEILERARNHLGDVGRRFREEGARCGDVRTQQLEAEIKQIEADIEAREAEKDTLIQNKEALKSQLYSVREWLRMLKESSELQRRRDELHEEERQIQNRIGEVRKRLANLVSKQGYLAFCGDLIEFTRSFLEEKRDRSEIPSPIKQQFVEDLLERGTCICGTPLVPGTPTYERVSEWRDKATNKDLDDAFIELSGDVKVLNEAVPRLFEQLQDAQQERIQLLQSLARVREELSQVLAQLEDKDTEEVGNLVRKDRELDAKLSETDQAIGRVEEKIEQLSREREEKKKQLKQRLSEVDKAALARRRMEVCDRLQEVIGKILELRASEVQEGLQQKISEVYSRMLRKPYLVEIDDDYSLNVYKYVGDKVQPVPMSQGERQVTSLAFIGAIVDIAREQYERESTGSVYFRGGLYPIVMDSPFGQMDEYHREHTARFIPKLAHQVIVMVASSQWHGPVEAEMKEAVGKEYVLEVRSPQQDATIPYEYTEVREVKDA